MTKVKAIDTIYRNYKFRSRLEARWAVFFDYAEIKWLYEDEGYMLPSGWYLPDFYLPKYDIFVEVKPFTFDMTKRGLDDKLCEELARGKGCCTWLVSGDPIEALPKRLHIHNASALDDPAAAARCYDNMFSLSAWLREDDNKRRKRGNAAARQARFEHGQSGAK